MSGGWHLQEPALRAYAEQSAGLAVAASAEAHLLACAPCRRALAGHVPAARLATVRDRVDDRIDAASRPLLERLLCRWGVAEADARVLLAAPALRRAWWLAVLLALVLTALATVQREDGGTALLLLAPLLPVVATATSFSVRLEPALELTAATPYPALRLLLLRSGTVAGASTLVTAAAAATALPGPHGQALVWLLPAVALSAAVVALSSWVDTPTAAGACSLAWLLAVWSAGRDRAGLNDLAVYDTAGQMASAAVLVAAVAVVVRHRDRLDPV